MTTTLHTVLLLTLYVAALAIFCTAAKRLPLLSPEAEHRVSALDGLRGILATAVIVHHFVLTYFWHVTSQWHATNSAVINNLGAVPVSLFFMITGYLFAAKVHRSTPDWSRLASSRLRRIFPMYLFSVLLIIAISFYQSRDSLAPFADTLSAMGHWMIFMGAPINGFSDTTRINAGVHWTLMYEAIFYLCLPLLYCLLHRRIPVKPLLTALLVLVFLLIEYRHDFYIRVVKLFASGIAVALLEGWLRRLPFDYASPRWTALAVALLGVALVVTPYSIPQLVLLPIPFALFVLGNSLHGLLEHRGMKILGEASFSIYLVHGIVIYVLFSVFGLFDFATGSLVAFAWYLPAIIVGVCGLSVATYWGIERPMIGRRKVGGVPAMA